MPFYIDHMFAGVGAIASYFGPAKALEKSWQRILHKSGAQPCFPLVAGKRVSPEQVRAVQAELTALPQSDARQAVLKTVGIQAFDTGSCERLRKLLDWLSA